MENRNKHDSFIQYNYDAFRCASKKIHYIENIERTPSNSNRLKYSLHRTPGKNIHAIEK